MSFLFYLLCLPFEADAKLLDSDKWHVRERAAYRLEKKLPWSLPVCFTKSKSASGESLKSRIRCSTWLGRYIAKLWAVGDFDQICEEIIDEFRLHMEITFPDGLFSVERFRLNSGREVIYLVK